MHKLHKGAQMHICAISASGRHAHAQKAQRVLETLCFVQASEHQNWKRDVRWAPEMAVVGMERREVIYGNR